MSSARGVYLTTDERTNAREYAQAQAIGSAASSGAFEVAYRQYVLALADGAAVADLDADAAIDLVLGQPGITQIGGGSAAVWRRLECFSRLVERYDPDLQGHSTAHAWVTFRQTRYLFDVMTKPFDQSVRDPQTTTIWSEIMTHMDDLMINDWCVDYTRSIEAQFRARRTTMNHLRRIYATRYGTAEKARATDAAYQQSALAAAAASAPGPVTVALAKQPASAGLASAWSAHSPRGTPLAYGRYTHDQITANIEALRASIASGRV
jgi:hypothetical protein